MSERLQKILSAHGAASRRESERLIIEGRVSVNGVTASLGQSADALLDVITIDGKRLPQIVGKVYIMLNKPRGVVTTMSDERGRKTAVQLVSGAGRRVYPVGRLDLDSEGLLILTNDGEFANAVMHPSFRKPKKYTVTVRGEIKGAAERLCRPTDIDGRIVKAAEVKLVELKPSGGIFDITILEGRNRQIRRMCARCGLVVTRLIRISVGGIELGGLKTGQWRYLTDKEVRKLMGEEQ